MIICAKVVKHSTKRHLFILKCYLQVIEELLGLDNVLHIGYRFSILTFFVRKELKQEEENIIKNQLASNNIFDYDVLEMTEYIDLKRICQVSSPIKLHTATLGGFAVCEGKDGKAKQLCALISGHIVRHIGETIEIAGKVVSIQNESILKCEDTTIDIAALVITDEMTDRFEFDYRFQSRNNGYKPCEVMPSSAIEAHKSMEVYLRGARTELGIGKISCSKLHSTCKHRMVLIEDFDKNFRFSQPGDSGAIVCFELPGGQMIKAVAMLTGKFTARDIEHTSNYPMYVALHLEYALGALSNKHGKFKLCN